MQNNNFYSQSDLLKKDFGNAQTEILEGLFRPGIYFLAGTSKIGKSLITTSLANSVSLGKPFLGKKTVQGMVVYFDNDNYAFESKERIIAQKFGNSDNILYNFQDSTSLEDIKDALLDLDNLDEFNLVIIDCLANLDEFPDTDAFTENYATIKEFRDFLVKHGLCCILVHHTKKGKSHTQDSVLGSKSLTSASTGTVLIETENEFSTRGKLRFILRSRKEIINIMKDDEGINWILDELEEAEESIDHNILLVITGLVKEETHKMVATCQELTTILNLDLNPKGLYRYLTKHKKTLNDNHVTFEKDRLNGDRVIRLIYSPEDDSKSQS